MESANRGHQTQSIRGRSAKRFFVREAFSTFKTTAAITPSSRYLTRAMVEPLSMNIVRTVVELGAGTGVMTRKLLDLLPDDATLIAFEINCKFFEYLNRNFSDSRLILINSSVELLGLELKRRGFDRVDAVVSSIAFSYLSDMQRHSLLSEIIPFMDSNGLFTQFQYIHGLQFQEGRLNRFNPAKLFRQYFNHVQRKITWRNLPPAFVFTCYK